MKTYIVIKDGQGILRPQAYMETKERHPLQKQPKLEEGESFVEIELREVSA